MKSTIKMEKIGKVRKRKCHYGNEEKFKFSIRLLLFLPEEMKYENEDVLFHLKFCVCLSKSLF